MGILWDGGQQRLSLGGLAPRNPLPPLWGIRLGRLSSDSGREGSRPEAQRGRVQGVEAPAAGSERQLVLQQRSVKLVKGGLQRSTLDYCRSIAADSAKIRYVAVNDLPGALI